MEKDDNNYSGGFLGVEFNGHDHLHQNGNQMVDYLLNNPLQHLPNSGGFGSSNSLDKLSFADVMQFADLGQKLSLNQSKTCHGQDEDEQTGIDPVYFLKFPVLNEDHQSLLTPLGDAENKEATRVYEGAPVGIDQYVGEDVLKTLVVEGKNKRKRTRTIKTSEEVESQRMTHIAVERNRRKQMNQHLRVLRSLMPGSYVQRGDQASIIGGAIEFVRELEQLLQCLESQKRRRLYGDTPRVVGDSSSALLPVMQQSPPVAMFYTPPDDQMKEDTAECKSDVADVEVRLLGFDAMIKILCSRRPGQLIKTIAALEDLQFDILHTNVTTIEQTVLYSFNVKVASEARSSAEEIANSVQQIIGFVHAITTT
ncbi:putative transcription factor bHLH family [Helianthus annuus]|uniref:Transcription factor bHLH family n=1 Tax=Helianthus annuus TaxID=4232 RepID=A0A9K3E1R9_HELAN|nr:transcription factor FAMA [Helianthus annuus]KAF5765494.1 putative transcription factor bHLH family [Helianthus annuus]KAJ0456757.1 putative transcription factor bHLH family [Helianthus annuus]KAJ0473909.1 putative transcription factor bHLH family [Helianthus annuus]KAJ0649484.1 putative transcription factor bHLH family [Helianthus annuus]KAJ0653285.1 putative transcription factor bHLH family [Helianthus annuus]